MTTRFARIFPDKNSVSAMVHFGALPGSPLPGAEGGHAERANTLMHLVRGARGH